MKKNSLSLKLLELRQKNNLTQKQLCDILNIGRSTYSYFETGTRTPDIDTLLLIAHFYQVSVDGLLGEEDEQKRRDQTMSSDGDTDMDISLTRHLKSKHIPVDAVMDLTKREFDFLEKFSQLSMDDQEELIYLMNYKIRKQKK